MIFFFLLFVILCTRHSEWLKSASHYFHACTSGTELRITVGEKSILTFHAHSYRLTPSVLIAKMRALVFSRRKDLKTQPLNKFTSFTIPRQTARGKLLKRKLKIVEEKVASRERKRLTKWQNCMRKQLVNRLSTSETCWSTAWCTLHAWENNMQRVELDDEDKKGDLLCWLLVCILMLQNNEKS